MGPYADVMIDHDKNVGTVLDKIKELGIDDNTIVFYSTDNGPHMNSWPDAAMTPFRNEKNSNWEGAYRVPAVVRWPGKIKPGVVSNEIVSHLDWMPTLLAAAGMPDVKERLLKGYKIGKMNYMVHLDGYNLVPYLTGEEKNSPRKEFFYFSDDSDLTGLRFDKWKFVFFRTKDAWHFGCMGRTAHQSSRAINLQSPSRSIRAREHHIKHLLRLVVGPRFHACSGSDLCRQISGDVQGLSGAAEGGELLDRSSHGKIEAADAS